MFIGISVISFCTQDIITVNDGKGWDGNAYYQVAEQMQKGELITGDKPFIYRQLLPYIASVLPFKILDSYYYINLIANFANVLLLLYFLKLYSKDFLLPIIFTGFYMLHWVGFLRFIHFYPSSCDSIAFLSILLLLIFTKKLFDTKNKIYLAWFVLTSFIGSLNREFVLFFSFPLLMLHSPIVSTKLFYIDFSKVWKAIIYVILPFLACFIGLLWVTSNAENTGMDYNLIRPLRYTVFMKSIPEFLLSCYNTFGVLIIFPIIFYKTTINFLKKEQYFIALIAIALFLSWGGGDTERFFMWFLPVFAVIMIKIIEKYKNIFLKPLLIIPVIGSLFFTLRLFWSIPQATPTMEQPFEIPIFTVFGNTSYLNLMSFYANESVVFVAVSQYLLLSIVLFFIVRYYLLQLDYGKEKIK